MHFLLHPSTLTLTALLFLFSPLLTTAYLILAYGQPYCTGPTQEVNVWDNTCANWRTPFRFFEVLVYEGYHQRALFYSDGCDGGTLSCNLIGNYQAFWADGGDASFQMGRGVELFVEMYSAESLAG
jgi:hypothetical protein